MTMEKVANAFEGIHQRVQEARLWGIVLTEIGKHDEEGGKATALVARVLVGRLARLGHKTRRFRRLLEVESRSAGAEGTIPAEADAGDPADRPSGEEGAT